MFPPSLDTHNGLFISDFSNYLKNNNNNKKYQGSHFLALWAGARGSVEESAIEDREGPCLFFLLRR